MAQGCQFNTLGERKRSDGAIQFVTIWKAFSRAAGKSETGIRQVSAASFSRRPSTHPTPTQICPSSGGLIQIWKHSP